MPEAPVMYYIWVQNSQLQAIHSWAAPVVALNFSFISSYEVFKIVLFISCLGIFGELRSIPCTSLAKLVIYEYTVHFFLIDKFCENIQEN